MTLPVAILAGGLATRLRPITEKIPKSLVEVAGEPFIVRQLDYLRRQRVRDVVLCVGYLGEMIEAVVGDGSRFGLTVSYSMDGPVLLGTGGALRRAAPLLGEACFVLYGDSYLPVDFAAIEAEFWASSQPALMTVLYNRGPLGQEQRAVRRRQACGIQQEGAAARFRLYRLRPKHCEARDSRELSGERAFDLATVYHTLSLEKRLHGYEVFKRFYEIGSPSGLKEADEFFRMGDMP